MIPWPLIALQIALRTANFTTLSVPRNLSFAVGISVEGEYLDQTMTVLCCVHTLIETVLAMRKIRTLPWGRISHRERTQSSRGRARQSAVGRCDYVLTGRDILHWSSDFPTRAPPAHLTLGFFKSASLSSRSWSSCLPASGNQRVICLAAFDLPHLRDICEHHHTAA